MPGLPSSIKKKVENPQVVCRLILRNDGAAVVNYVVVDKAVEELAATGVEFVVVGYVEE